MQEPTGEAGPWQFDRVVEVLVGMVGAAVLAWGVRANPAWLQLHVLVPHWRWTDVDLLQATALRRHALIAGLALLFIARPIAGRLTPAWSLPTGVRRALPSIGAALLAVVFAGWCLEHWRRPPPRPAAPAQPRNPFLGQKLGGHHERYGWLFAPSQELMMREGGREVWYAVDAWQDRAAHAEPPPDPAAPSLVFVGESFTAGQGLNWDETYPAVVGQRAGLQVINLGVHGFGSDQAYLRLVDTLPRLQHPVAIVSMFHPIQIGRALQRWRTRLVLDGDRLVPQPPEHGWLESVRLVRIWRELYFGDAELAEAIAIERRIVRETLVMARARGAQALFVVPTYGPLRSPSERPDTPLLEAILGAEQAPYVVVDIDLSWRLQGDPHPDPRGAREIADAVTARLRLPLDSDGRSP